MKHSVQGLVLTESVWSIQITQLKKSHSVFCLDFLTEENYKLAQTVPLSTEISETETLNFVIILIC
jgi:hypothetical protein